MRRQTFLLLATLLTFVGCAKSPDTKQAPVAQGPTPIATTRQVMLGITIPTSDVLFQVGNAAPKDDLEWEKVQANAAALAESANLLLVPPRLIDQPEWKGFVKQLVETASLAQQAAQAHDVDKVLDVGNQIYEVCDGCHKKYMAARAGETQ